MLVAERRSLILEKIHEDKKVIVSELGRQFKVSEETIRRDLEKLSEEGVVTKTYGGAVLKDNSGIDLPFNVRAKVNPEGKRAMAKLVCNKIEDGDHIFLDASTTSVYIAKSIKEKKNLTVVTNSIENLLELSNIEGWNIISTGGCLKPGSMALSGSRALESIRSFNVDRLFLSCKGFDIKCGITDGNDDAALIKQNMIKSSAEVCLVVDSTKFDKTAFSKICKLTDVDVVITDKKPNDMWLEAFKKSGIKCEYCSEE